MSQTAISPELSNAIIAHNNYQETSFLPKKYAFFQTPLTRRVDALVINVIVGIANALGTALCLFVAALNLLTAGLIKKLHQSPFGLFQHRESTPGTDIIAKFFAAIMALLRSSQPDGQEFRCNSVGTNPLHSSKATSTLISFPQDCPIFTRDAVTDKIEQRSPDRKENTFFHRPVETFFINSMEKLKISLTANPWSEGLKSTGKHLCFHAVAFVAYLVFAALTIITRTLDFALGLGAVLLSLLMGIAALCTSNVRFNVATDRVCQFAYKHLAIMALPLDILRAITLAINPTRYTIC